MQSRLGAPSEHQTSDASIGYPPGLTGERLISFAINSISCIFAKTLFTGGAKHYSLDLQFISFTNKQNRNTANFANTIHWPAKTLFKNPQVYTRNTYDFLTTFRLIRFTVFGFLINSLTLPLYL